jgi:MoaA/NifB/PqqE/SkfB family radical SAM enzyme
MQFSGTGPGGAWRTQSGRLISRPLSAGLRLVTRRLRQVRIASGCLRGLQFVWLEITRRCNLTCAHCYASSSPDIPLEGRMRLRDWRNVLDAARAVGCRRVQFIGGEPTLYPGLATLLEHSARSGFRQIEVFTNATQLGDELLHVLRRWRIRVASSFYSADAAAHDRITGHPGSFERTVGGLRALLAKKIPLRVGLIEVERDPAQLRRAKRFLKDLGVKSIDTDRVRGIGRGRQMVPGARPAAELCGYCWQGKLSVDADGRAYPCVFSRFVPVGNVLDEELPSILAGDALKSFRRQCYLE